MAYYTGFYRESIYSRKKEAHAAVAKVQKSLSSLQNDNSAYAEEHRELLSVLLKVAAVYDSAQPELTPNR